MNKHQRACLDLSQRIHFLSIQTILLPFQTLRPPLPIHIHKPRPTPLHPHKPLRHRRSPVRPLGKTQTPILRRRILQRNPEADRTRRVGIEERGILMRRHRASDLRLLAYHHALQHSGVPEPEISRYGRIARCQRRLAKGRRQTVQVVADFVDGAGFGFGEGAVWREGGFLEEEADFVAGGEEIVVADVRGGFTCGKLGQRVGGKRKVVEEVVGFSQEGGGCGGADEGGDDEVAVAVVGLKLRGRQTSCFIGGLW